MPEAGEPAPLEQWLAEQLPSLSALYDRFAHALDPFDPGRDVAEHLQQRVDGYLRFPPGAEAGISGFSPARHRALQEVPKSVGQAFGALTWQGQRSRPGRRLERPCADDGDLRGGRDNAT